MNILWDGATHRHPRTGAVEMSKWIRGQHRGTTVRPARILTAARPDEQMIYLDGDKANLRPSNLRAVSRPVAILWRQCRSGKVPRLQRKNRKWCASILHAGRYTWLGAHWYRESAEEAWRREACRLLRAAGLRPPTEDS